ncbi:hypothetical protein CSC70_12785 [Pseudoxanthomonas kalamensis DSM 18571]|uniref:hypothetical protein n=1 Tax=Pseudoxanthomonas kalamensis TaxID=289483 RepID=UPI001391427F|nr:hypothetical protein [Pseudoxanthomonas kalamensis]KAF1708582.1 hypothetical protein CSC70_12785 [Pseudoxanthomonas kalamensis DSM 18571]
MSQNLLSLTLTDEDMTAINAALTELEARLIGLLALDNATRRQITKMGDKSEAFVRQTMTVLEQNPDIVPPALGLAEAQADLVALDRLRPLQTRLQRLLERVSDSEMALGSDLMSVALEGYGLLKVSGRNRGLEGAVEALGARFSHSSRRTAEQPAT